MAVSKRARFEVLRRDNHTCRYCGSAAPDVKLQIDHVVPVALGGSDAPENLVTACADCNRGKASITPGGPLVDDVKATDMRWAEAVKRAAALQEKEREAAQFYTDSFIIEWPSYRRAPDDWQASVHRLYVAGLPLDQMLDAARVAASQRGVYDRFAYFMGCSWKRLAALHDTAKELLAADDEGATNA